MGGIHFAPLMFDGRVSEQRCERRDASGYGTQEGEHHKEYRECGGGPSGYPGSGDTPIFWVRMVILIFEGVAARAGAFWVAVSGSRGSSGGGLGWRPGPGVMALRAAWYFSNWRRQRSIERSMLPS